MKEGSGSLAGCCGCYPLLQQRKYASCHETEKRSGEMMSTGEGSDSWSGQSV